MLSEPSLARAIEALSKLPGTFRDESRMHSGVENVLRKAGFAPLHEHAFDSKNRIDFFLPAEGIGIECKVAGSENAVRRQLQRYAHHCTHLILVTNQIQPVTIRGFMIEGRHCGLSVVHLLQHIM